MVECVCGCIVCYGVYGQGMDNDYFLCFVGKLVEYLYNQFVNFCDGWCKYLLMNYLLMYLSDDYLCEIVEYFLVECLLYLMLVKLMLLVVMFVCGKQFVMQGDLFCKLLVCVVCYGVGLIGMQLVILGFVGLYVDYLSVQFGVWCLGNCYVKVFDCMYDIVVKFFDEDVMVVIVWFVV